MSAEIAELVDKYVRWIKDKTVLLEVSGGWTEITTPHLDRHNDQLQIYVKKQGDGFVLTDDGYIISDLISSGCSLDSPKREALLKMTLAGFGVHQTPQNQLETQATAENFPLKKHNLLQAMLAVNDLFYLATPFMQSIFYEDVQKWLDESDIRYTPNCKFTGKSGYDHKFDFVIPKSRRQPERILQTVNNPSKDAVEGLMFKWLDTKDTRQADARLYVMLNDERGHLANSLTNAFSNYGAVPVPWSEHEQTVEILRA
ncbi:MAG: DUF1829 domain-containing protein [Verrucomicrobiales bacterium]|jgi:hypothetical protein|nr:DUF1829 domain-containing protein [Verrucomicrobiales bacterium]